jgi:hypothetical protein
MDEDGSGKSKLTLWLVITVALVVLPPILIAATAFVEETIFGTRNVAGFCKAIGVLGHG